MFLSSAKDFQGFARGFFYVFIALFPFLQYQAFLFNGTSTRSFNLVIVIEILIIGLAIILFKKANDLVILKSPISLGLLIFFLVLCLSSVLGVDFSTSFWSKATRTSGLFYFIHLGFFYFLLTMLFREEKQLRKFIKIFLISAGVFSLGALLSKDGFGLIFANREWQGFTFGNSTFAGMYLFSAFILSIYYIFSMEKVSRRWWHRLLPIIFFLNPYLLSMDVWRGKVNIFKDPLGIIGGAQASSYTLIFSVLILLIIFGISKIREVKIRRGLIWGGVVVGLSVGTFAVYSLLSPGGFIQEKYLNQASLARPIVWNLSKEAISERPAFGFGVDNFDRAYEAHYDNQVMEKIKGGEAWFDRAHNIFIDQTIETGYLGISVYVLLFLIIIGSMLYVVFRSTVKNDQTLAVFVIVYFIGHLMELQTAFDTTISYVPLTIFSVLATQIFHKTYKSRIGERGEWKLSENLKYIFATVVIGIFGTFFFVGTVPILRAQTANGTVRTIGSSEKRLPVYPILFNSPVDTAGFLNRTVVDFQKGIGIDPSILEKPDRIEGFKKELEVFVIEYKNYLETHPDDYRARLKLADLYIYQRLFGVDNLDEAHTILDRATELVPEAPQAYWMQAVAYLYQRNFPKSREFAKKALDLNPNIEESQRLQDYIEKSIKTFPEIDLYSFRMI